MIYETLRYEIADRVLTLTLNRPERMNAFTARMADEPIDAFDRADADEPNRNVRSTLELNKEKRDLRRRPRRSRRHT